MYDMTKEYRRWCSSNENWSHQVQGSNGKTYLVTWGRVHGRDTQYGYTCTCDAFKFGKGKECKHIVEAKKHHCMFNHDAVCGGGAEIHDDVCPKCGAEMTTIAILV